MKNLLQKSKQSIREGTFPLLVFLKAWSVASATPIKRFLDRERAWFKHYRSFFEGKIGLEIGGPSGIFSDKGMIPIYRYAERIDNCNFSNETIWGGSIPGGPTYRYSDQKVGNQFICEGNDLKGIAEETYDFVIASHSIEHFADPIKAVKEWSRVLKRGGALLVVAPDKRFTFDHRRQITSFEHLVEDHRSGIGEDDLTHLGEILSLHDLLLDSGVGTAQEFAERARKNNKHRSLHQHVFDRDLLRRLFSYCGVEVLTVDFALPCHTIMMGRKAV